MILSSEILASLLTLTLLEIVLGVDNLIFISVLVQRLPMHQRNFARKLGLFLAMLTRLLLLFTLSWLTQLDQPFWHPFSHPISVRDLILMVGGLFLLAKGTREIHDNLEAHQGISVSAKPKVLLSVCLQIMILDIVFSLDSVITAVGMTPHLWVMVAAIVLAMLVMLFASAPLSDFIHHHPPIKMLALSFLLLVGTMLVADGAGFHVPRGYLYFSIAFSLFVEILNLIALKKKQGSRVHP